MDCSDKATFYTNGKFNRHNVRIWGTDSPRETIENDSLKQDGPPPHWHLSVRDYLNVNYPRRWIGLQEALILPPAIFWGPPLPAIIDDLKHEITTAIQTVTPDILLRDLIKQNKGESRYSTRSMVLIKSATVTDRIRTCAISNSDSKSNVLDHSAIGTPKNKVIYRLDIAHEASFLYEEH
ncbi:hypothetical protein J6590_078337 [Homalodisca vitripennis]|nr:hypothetical protein J6590_078337 [Homalodisca vitripennis]